MASQNTTLFASQIFSADYVVGTSSVHAQSLPSSADAGGVVKVICDSFTTTSAVATTETLTLCKLPAGARVINFELLIDSAMGTTSSKIGIGTIDSAGTVTVTDDDRYGTGISWNSTGRVPVLTLQANADYITTTEVAVVVTPVTTSLTTAKTFQFIITYVTS